jgi:hypothetical protein
MKKWKVTWEQITWASMIVEAKDEDDAVEKVEEGETTTEEEGTYQDEMMSSCWDPDKRHYEAEEYKEEK